jgi:hypothetical protein
MGSSQPGTGKLGQTPQGLQVWLVSVTEMVLVRVVMVEVELLVALVAVLLMLLMVLEV